MQLVDVPRLLPTADEERAAPCTVRLSPAPPFVVQGCDPAFVQLIGMVSVEAVIGKPFGSIAGCAGSPHGTNSLVGALSELALTLAPDRVEDDVTADLDIVLRSALGSSGPTAHHLRVRPMRDALTRDVVALACTLQRVFLNELEAGPTIDKMRALALRELGRIAMAAQPSSAGGASCGSSTVGTISSAGSSSSSEDSLPCSTPFHDSQPMIARTRRDSAPHQAAAPIAPLPPMIPRSTTVPATSGAPGVLRRLSRRPSHEIARSAFDDQRTPSGSPLISLGGCDAQQQPQLQQPPLRRRPRQSADSDPLALATPPSRRSLFVPAPLERASSVPKPKTLLLDGETPAEPNGALGAEGSKSCQGAAPPAAQLSDSGAQPQCELVHPTPATAFEQHAVESHGRDSECDACMVCEVEQVAIACDRPVAGSC